MYRIENLELGIKTIINGTVRSVIGKTDLDGVQSNRKHIADEIETELQHIASEWGIKLTKFKCCLPKVLFLTNTLTSTAAESSRQQGH
jgi:regulator of protease activity HflC (stomatin/prohibitin superfamily)